MTERRYDDDEVAEIFAAASAPEAEHRSAARPGHGLTLQELKEIGREIGVAPERIADAAKGLETRRGALGQRRELGMPLAVGRIVDLPRAPTDREWDLLVTALRETFDARGRTSAAGEIREWSNGNLHAYVEPTVDGWQLRLGTLNGFGQQLNRLAPAGIVFAIALAIMLYFTGDLAESWIAPAIFAMLSAAGLVRNAVVLPRWAEEREVQMAEIAELARVLITGDADD